LNYEVGTLNDELKAGLSFSSSFSVPRSAFHMSQPEISRRCRSCGAAVRAGARFCPQCGALMADAGAAEQAVVAPDTGELEPLREVEPPREAEAAREWTPPTKEYAAFVQSFEGAQSGAGETASGAQSEVVAESESPGVLAEDAPRRADEPAPPAASQSYVAPAASDEDFDGDASGGEAGAGDVRGRVARVREGTRARVGRMREEAIVVLEETPDDSGLRFVLAALALFIIFLVLLFLSTTILR
jgi:hypothetical protein